MMESRRIGLFTKAHAFVRASLTSKSVLRFVLIHTLALPLLAVCAGTTLAQSATPTPAAGPPQQVRDLTDIAVRFVPAVKRVVEGAMLRRYTFLATVFAQIIMLAAFLKLQADKPGATRDFFGQCGRSIIILPLILMGPWLISYLYTLGGQ